MRNEYIISSTDAHKSEKIIREFLFGICDTVKITEVKWRDGLIFGVKKLGGENDPKFLEILEALKPSFVKKITDHKRFNDIEQGKSEFTHYLYHLDQAVKNKINEDGLLWLLADEPKNFYGFEDPNFYQGETKIASITSHHSTIFLYLTDSEKEEMDSLGMVFNQD